MNSPLSLGQASTLQLLKAQRAASGGGGRSDQARAHGSAGGVQLVMGQGDTAVWGTQGR